MLRALFATCLLAALALSSAGTTEDGWDNHFAAFGSMNTTKIMEDYTEYSQVIFFDQLGSAPVIYDSLTEIEDMFDNLFSELNYTGSNPSTTWEDPVVEEAEDSELELGMVFLLWNGCHADDADCPYRYMTDTFVFDEDGKILRQTIVKFPGDGGETACPGAATNPTVVKANVEGAQQMAWENHFGAFGGQNLTNIMEDYDDRSTMRLYNYLDDDSSRAITLVNNEAGINATFTGLFAAIEGASDVSAPVVITQTFANDGEADDTAFADYGITYLVWRSPTYGFPWVTDTFVYDAQGTIIRQNIAYLDSCTAASGDDDDDDDDDDDAVDEAQGTASLAGLSASALLFAAALQM